VQSKEDRREYRLRLTPSGRRLFRELEPLVLDYERKLLNRLGESEGRRVDRAVAALEEALGLRPEKLQ
jgi:DNA-binding MarR family transcriptional regulator